MPAVARRPARALAWRRERPASSLVLRAGSVGRARLGAVRGGVPAEVKRKGERGRAFYCKTREKNKNKKGMNKMIPNYTLARRWGKQKDKTIRPLSLSHANERERKSKVKEWMGLEKISVLWKGQGKIILGRGGVVHFFVSSFFLSSVF